MKRQIILDTETTGLKPEDGHRIIEIGCVEMINRRLTGNNFHQYINPEREVDQGALQVHGLTNEFLLDKPIFSDVIKRLIEYIDGAELIIHNAAFDVGFLDYEFSLCGFHFGKVKSYCEVIDTLTMARRMHPGQRNSLDALCKRYDVSNAHRKLHGALLDAEILASVYLAMTGGQETLFAEKNTQSQTSSVRTQIVNEVTQGNHDLPMIYANEVELSAHEKFLQWLEKKSAQVIWRKIDRQEDDAN